MTDRLPKRLAVLGSTGSIGTQCMEVVAGHPDQFSIVGLSGHHNTALLAEQVRKFAPRCVITTQPEGVEDLRARINGAPVQLECGAEAMSALAADPEVDLLVVATVGGAGLKATLAALAAGKPVALANKEVLVMGGDLVMAMARKMEVEVLPIDSEHSAIFQCSWAERASDIARIVVTASGGPFRDWPYDRIAKATPEQALDHPTWNMGPKITIDSATLMNKGLEIIEAHHFFGLPAGRIDVVVHPQSIVHSLVEYVDGSVLAQLGHPDMRIPIQYALSYPRRLPRATKRLDLAQVGQLTFEAPDLRRFPCLCLAYNALRRGGTAPAILSVSNEVAVQAFRDGLVGFFGIAEIVADALATFPVKDHPTLEDILNVDQQVRDYCSGRLRVRR